MIQGNVAATESGKDVAAFTGNVKDTAHLVVIGLGLPEERTNSAEQYNTPSFNFRDYWETYETLPADVFPGTLTWTAPIDVVTWGLGGGLVDQRIAEITYGKCVYLMLRF